MEALTDQVRSCTRVQDGSAYGAWQAVIPTKEFNLEFEKAADRTCKLSVTGAQRWAGGILSLTILNAAKASALTDIPLLRWKDPRPSGSSFFIF